VGAVVVLGERARVASWALGGAVVIGADTPEEVRQGWADLGASDVAVLLLTPTAAASLAAELAAARRQVGHATAAPLTAVLPA
jgi:vacuolar-type H+-ATPase subunit F/Vma7